MANGQLTFIIIHKKDKDKQCPTSKTFSKQVAITLIGMHQKAACPGVKFRSVPHSEVKYKKNRHVKDRRQVLAVKTNFRA